MPKIFYTHNNTIEHSIYKDESELPRNVKIFIKEIRRDFPNDELKLYTYNEFKNLETNEFRNDLDLSMDIDAERYAKGEYHHIKEVDTKFDGIANSIGINRFHIP